MQFNKKTSILLGQVKVSVNFKDNFNELFKTWCYKDLLMVIDAIKRDKKLGFKRVSVEDDMNHYYVESIFPV